uniref:N-(5'-phosphoribosyl)anthranilate isomerase n=1 Tax=Schlesneria paludicola TaxID=360056 RepID=A0A7C2P780_9PLAN
MGLGVRQGWRAVWTKICGIRDPAVLEWLLPLAPSAIGLNFFPSSPRFVSPEVARDIASRLPPHIESVGVFVNVTAPEAAGIAEMVGLNRVQFHGDDPPALLAEFQRLCPTASIIRAARMPVEGLAGLAAYLDECRNLGVVLSACLIDAYVTGHYGGTGTVVSWDKLRQDYRTREWPPLILAGGLTAGNVAAAIRTVKPWGVDVASGVESSPGVKDRTLTERFLAAARG